MSQISGRSVSDRAHVHQSIRDVLTTPLGSRVMRPTYGSRLFELVDHPMDQALRVEIFVATSEALRRWEPRVQITRMIIDHLEPGHLTLTLEGRYTPNGSINDSEPLRLEGINV